MIPWSGEVTHEEGTEAVEVDAAAVLVNASSRFVDGADLRAGRTEWARFTYK